MDENEQGADGRNKGRMGGGRADEQTSGRAYGQMGADGGGRGLMRGGRADGEQKRGLWAIRPPVRPFASSAFSKIYL